jgi:PhnB protein
MQKTIATNMKTQVVVPYFMVRNAPDFINFARNVFQAELVSSQTRENSEDVIHAEIAISGNRIFLADSGQCGGNWISPSSAEGSCAKTDGGKSIQIFLYVESADDTCRNAAAAGAVILMEPYDDNGGRMCGILDPFENIWWLKSPIPTENLPNDRT